MATDQIQQIADLLHEVGEIHHVYYADTDGVDDDWATFYSEWLLRRSPLPQLLPRARVRSALTRSLVVLDEEYTAAAPSEAWPTWYATRLIATFG